jgi:hypothetical protein
MWALQSRAACVSFGRTRLAFSDRFHTPQRDMPIRAILDKMRHDGCSGRAAKAEGVSRRAVRRIVSCGRGNRRGGFRVRRAELPRGALERNGITYSVGTGSGTRRGLKSRGALASRQVDRQRLCIQLGRIIVQTFSGFIARHFPGQDASM